MMTLSTKLTKFQHTAARRRLGQRHQTPSDCIGFNTQPPEGGWLALESRFLRTVVSTHSRPKAAGCTARTFRDVLCVSTHSRPKAAGVSKILISLPLNMFQHTAARRRLAATLNIKKLGKLFQHTAARRRLDFQEAIDHTFTVVSTHSRPKAAGQCAAKVEIASACFNTQPPEGGWVRIWIGLSARLGFNTQPPEGGWIVLLVLVFGIRVSTHSRPKAAGDFVQNRQVQQIVSTHSRPKAAGKHTCLVHICIHVSTHSRPKAAGRFVWW